MGDGQVWMALGLVLLDQAQRLRWIPLLGAVDEAGALVLPPFLACLVPENMTLLPQGWWEYLLGSQDATGLLLPQGRLDPSLPWAELQRHGEPLVLASLPLDLEPHREEPWLCSLPDGAWMLDPRLRAWTRGLGPGPGLATLLPPSLGLGTGPEPPLAEWLDLRLPREPPPDWTAALQADLREDQCRPELPPPSGHPTWDRLRMRWGGEAAATAPGYPAWETLGHPCADPFHLMAQSLRFSQACEPGLARPALYATARRLGVDLVAEQLRRSRG